MKFLYFKKIDSTKVILVFLSLLLFNGCSMHSENRTRDHEGKKGGFFSSSTKLTTTGALLSPLVGHDHKKNYIRQNLIALQEEAAKGEGPHLEALAALLGENDINQFNQWIHTNYEDLFTNLKNQNGLIERIDQ